MDETRAGLFIFIRKPHVQVLLAHPGGPEYHEQDEGVWAIPWATPKTEDESLLTAARRTLYNEMGLLPKGDMLDLGAINPNNKPPLQAWATEFQIPDDFVFTPPEFLMEWPPESGQKERFPAISRIEYFTPFEANRKIVPALRPFISRLISACSG